MGKIKNWAISVFVGLTLLVSTAFQSDFFEIAKQIDIYTTLFKELNMYYIDAVNPAKLSNKAISSMLESLDPYTRYYDEQGVEDARIAATGEYGGIGVVTRYKNNNLSIRELLKNSPAEKAGIKPGDKILKINDVEVKDFDETGVAALLNGLPNTKVNLQIERQKKKMEFSVTREKITVNPVPYYTMLANEVGYISFTTFNEKAAFEVKKAFLDLKEQGMKKLIIDVRGNPGGLLNEAVSIANFFLPKDKIVVTTKAKIEKWSDTFKTLQAPMDLEIPIAILINNSSASASEILAGSLQDYDRAVIIGERSFGKGLVQRYLPLSYGTQLKITISKYYTPSGRCIQELDYTNTDEKGNVPKFTKSTATYKTEKGRTVYGGGGIFPDVEIEKPTTTKTTETLINSDAFFNFATQYFYENSTIAEASKFKLADSDYASFISYLGKNHASFETKAEAEFRKALETASSENLNGNTSKGYSELLSAIQSEKFKELDKNKDEIINNLSEEIIKRYYYAEGVYKQKAIFDRVLLKAVSILNNEAAYQKIIGK